MRITLSVIAALAMSFDLFAQSRADIDRLISRIEAGEAEKVRNEIPALLDRYPNNPGILYVQGLATQDGADAVRIFQGIVDGFSKSEWADDALYKVYQFYYALGLYRTAEMKLEQLKTEYPNSKHLLESQQVQTGAMPEERGNETSVRAGQEVTGPVDTASPAPVAVGQFALQVGAYAAQENAEKQKLFFEDLGFPVEVVNKVKDSRSLFLVLVGNYLTYEDARAAKGEIATKHGIESFVVSR